MLTFYIILSDQSNILMHEIVYPSENSQVISADIHPIPPTSAPKSEASNGALIPISKQSQFQSIEGQSESQMISEEIIFDLIDHMKLPIHPMLPTSGPKSETNIDTPIPTGKKVSFNL